MHSSHPSGLLHSRAATPLYVPISRSSCAGRPSHNICCGHTLQRDPRRHTSCQQVLRALSAGSVAEPDGSLGVADSLIPPSNNNGSSMASSSTEKADEAPAAPQQDPQTTWGVAAPPEEDWQGSKPLTLKDVDWGLAGLLGIILLLSFGAYRILDHFRVYQRNRVSTAPQITTVVERPADSSSSSSPTLPASSSKPKTSKSKSKQDKANSKSSSGSSAATAAVVAGPEAAAVLAPPGNADGTSQQPAEADTAVGTKASASAAFDSTAAPPSFDLLPAGTPGAPQPSPLDAGFSSMPTPWAGTDLGQLDFAPLQLPEGLAQPPELPSIQVEPPAKAVQQQELAALPGDPSLPSLRERAHIAMRASGAAMEASQRAAAYSAAASSAASRAAEAAEQAAAAASAVQSALESAAEDAMAEAVKRMNRAVEMVADAESRAAAAAAMATAYQDISDSQAAAASTAADLPAMPQRQQQQGRIANLRQVLHQQMFSAGGLLADWVASVWAAIVAAVSALQASLAAAWGRVVGLVSGPASKGV